MSYRGIVGSNVLNFVVVVCYEVCKYVRCCHCLLVSCVALFGVIVAVPIIGDDVFVSCVVICVVCVVML